MINNEEIRGLWQDVDALSEQAMNLIETQEMHHAEILAKLDRLEEMLGDLSEREVSQADIEDIKTSIEMTNSEVHGVSEAIQGLDERLDQKGNNNN